MIVQFSDYCLPLLLHIDSNVRGNLGSIKWDYRALGAVVKVMGAQVVPTSSVLLMRGKDVRKRALIEEVKNWLWNWCGQQGLRFCDRGTLFEDQCLLGRDGVQLSKWGKDNFADSMADLIRRAINKEEGEGTQRPCEGVMHRAAEQWAQGDVAGRDHKINDRAKAGYFQHLQGSKEMPTRHYYGELPQTPSSNTACWGTPLKRLYGEETREVRGVRMLPGLGSY